MALKDLLHIKKDKEKGEASDTGKSLAPPEDIPEFTFLRTTTNTQEVIQPPNYPGDRAPERLQSTSQKRTSRFRRHTNAAASPPPNLPAPAGASGAALDARPKSERRLSERLHLGSRSRSASTSSVNIPGGLPEIGTIVGGTGAGKVNDEEEEAKWEERATVLAKSNPNVGKAGGSSVSLLDESGDV